MSLSGELFGDEFRREFESLSLGMREGGDEKREANKRKKKTQ